MSEPEVLQLTLAARTENVAVVRHALAGLAESIGMNDEGIGDLKTIVTEACMNVVIHAYEDEGALDVEARPDEEGLTVVVRDYGGGIRPRADLDRPSLKLGLPLIAALSDSFEIAGGIDQGTRITMRLRLRKELQPAEEDISGEPAGLEGASARAVSSPTLIAPVLGRMVGALAARRDITIDRLSDAMLLSDAISAGAPGGFLDGRVRVVLSERDRGVTIRVGPMESGAADRIRDGFDVPGTGGSLEHLAEEVKVDSGEEGEYLEVQIGSGAP
jgi:serine/threonine-protein kinase RsbW